MKFIKGEKVFLGPIDFDVIKEDYYNWINSEENRDGLNSGYYPKTKKHLESFIESSYNDDRVILFGIYASDNSSYIGNAKIGPIDWKNRVAEFGRFIGNRNYRGKGIGTEVTRLLLSHCFNQLNLNKVISGCLENNIGSKLSNERNGLKIEGILKEHIYEQGKFHDVFRFGILKSDYETYTKNKASQYKI